MRVIFLVFLVFSTSTYGGSVYQCKDENGQTAFQDRPCSGETVEVSEAPKSSNSEGFKNEIIKALARISGKSEGALIDPETRRAAEALAAVDAGKSYAFTKIYGVSAKYCGASVKRALENYESEASDIIALGKYFYRNGIKTNVGFEEISKSGKELTDGLNGMLNKLDIEHKTASRAVLKRKCREASQALGMAVKLYGS